MTLSVGNKVYLSANSGLMADPPLFGVVDVTTGPAAPDVVRVCWENGATQFFQSTNEAAVGLVIMGDDGAESVVGIERYIRLSPGVARFMCKVARTWVVGATRRALVSIGSLYAIVDFSALELP